MRISKPIQSLLPVLTVAILAACASGGGGEAGTPETSADRVAIRVMNDIIPPGNVVVWIVPEGGTRTRLGNLQSNGQRTFTYSPAVRMMQYYLLATPEGPATGTMQQAQELKSEPFSLQDIRSVNWSVSRPNVRTAR